jgi:hypothetical protein
MCESGLLQRNKAPTFPSRTTRPTPETPFGWPFLKETTPVALVTAYLARTAQRYAGRTTAGATRTVLDRIATYIRAASTVVSEAQEMRRAMTQKYPFTDN